LGAGWLQLDTVWLAMQAGAEKSSRVARLLDVPAVLGDPALPDESVLEAFVEAAGVVCEALPSIFEFELNAQPVMVADGAWLLPSFVAGLSLPGTEIRSAYLSHSHLADVTVALSPRLAGRPRMERHEVGDRRIWQCGLWICNQARGLGLPVVESLPFTDLTERVWHVVEPGEIGPRGGST
jgi:hypothetical protein